MTPFEEQLKQALARQEPSADFTSRVLAEAARQESQKEARGWRAWFRKGWFQAPLMQAWRLAPVMAAFLVVSGVVAYREHQREVQGQAAKQQLLQALRIAGTKLHHTQLRVVAMETDGTEWPPQ
ncbi:MAG: hypothetical protein WBW33_13295 [Bryobacteraceae bacterium]